MDSHLIFPFLDQKINQILYSSLISIQNKWQFWGFHRRLICAIFHVVLRREGYVTGILSGKEMKEPVALQFDAAEAAKFIKANKEGTQIYLDIEGEKVDALVKNIDYNPIEKQLMALDFQALVAGEKVSTTVAVKLEHTELVQGIVEQEMEEIHYKADPANLLDTIVVDFNGYPADVRDIHVKDLPIPEGKQVHFITPEDAVVVHIGEYEAAPEEDEDAEGAETEAK